MRKLWKFVAENWVNPNSVDLFLSSVQADGMKWKRVKETILQIYIGKSIQIFKLLLFYNRNNLNQKHKIDWTVIKNMSYVAQINDIMCENLHTCVRFKSFFKRNCNCKRMRKSFTSAFKFASSTLLLSRVCHIDSFERNSNWRRLLSALSRCLLSSVFIYNKT